MAAAVPAWVIYTAAATSIASAAVSAFATYGRGKTEKAAYEYNARLREQKAAYEEEQARERLQQLLGRQRVLYAKAGVDISSGSPLMLMAETAARGEREALNIGRFGAEEAGLYRMYGEAAAKAGVLGAGSTFLSGLATAGSMLYAMGRGAYRFKTPYRAISGIAEVQ